VSLAAKNAGGSRQRAGIGVYSESEQAEPRSDLPHPAQGPVIMPTEASDGSRPSSELNRTRSVNVRDDSGTDMNVERDQIEHVEDSIRQIEKNPCGD
jgi:hypothetical protein